MEEEANERKIGSCVNGKKRTEERRQARRGMRDDRIGKDNDDPTRAAVVFKTSLGTSSKMKQCRKEEKERWMRKSKESHPLHTHTHTHTLSLSFPHMYIRKIL
jgi:hypothetical protein